MPTNNDPVPEPRNKTRTNKAIGTALLAALLSVFLLGILLTGVLMMTGAHPEAAGDFVWWVTSNLFWVVFFAVLFWKTNRRKLALISIPFVLLFSLFCSGISNVASKLNSEFHLASKHGLTLERVDDTTVVRHPGFGLVFQVPDGDYEVSIEENPSTSDPIWICRDDLQGVVVSVMADSKTLQGQREFERYLDGIERGFLGRAGEEGAPATTLDKKFDPATSVGILEVEMGEVVISMRVLSRTGSKTGPKGTFMIQAFHSNQQVTQWIASTFSTNPQFE